MSLRGSLTLFAVLTLSLSASAQTFESALAEMSAAKIGDRIGSLPCQMPQRLFWTPEQVLADRTAALIAGDIDRVMCSYAPDAVLIMPGMVLRGRDEIRVGLEQLYALFGDVLPGEYTLTGDGPVWQLAFRLIGPLLSIPDGSDTYVITLGHIIYHTVHNTIVPTETLPPQNP